MQGQYTSLAEVEAIDPGHPRADKFNVRAMCPFCGQGKKVCQANRDLSYNSQNGRFRCFACDERGTFKEFWTEKERTPDYKSGVRVSLKARSAAALAEFNGDTARPFAHRSTLSKFDELPSRPKESAIPVTTWEMVKESFNNHLVKLTEPDGAPGAAYLRNERGIDVEFAHKCGVRYAPSFYGKPAIMFPLRREDGSPCAAQGRFLAKEVKPKALTRGPLEGVFSTPGALDPGAVIVIVEGPIDAITLAMAGVPSIAICGSSSVPDWLVQRCALSTVWAAFDNDKCTEKHPRGAGDHAAEFLSGKVDPVGGKVKRLKPPKRENKDKTDWNDILVDRGVDGLREVLKSFLAKIAQESAPLALPEYPKPEPIETAPKQHQNSIDADDFSDLAEEGAAVSLELGDDEPIPLTYWAAEYLMKGIIACEIAEWKSTLGDRYSDVIRTLRAGAEEGTLPFPTDAAPITLRAGHTVGDPNRFIMLAVASIQKLRRELAFVQSSTVRDRITDALAVHYLEVDIVARWYHGQKTPSGV